MGIENRGVDRLGLAGPAAVIESLDDPDGGQEPITAVPERGEAPEGPAPVVASTVLPGDAGKRSSRLVVAGLVRARTAIEPSSVAVDQVRVDIPERSLVARQPGQGGPAHVG